MRLVFILLVGFPRHEIDRGKPTRRMNTNLNNNSLLPSFPFLLGQEGRRKEGKRWMVEEIPRKGVPWMMMTTLLTADNLLAALSWREEFGQPRKSR